MLLTEYDVDAIKEYFKILNPMYVKWEWVLELITEKEGQFKSAFNLIVYMRTYSRFIPQLRRRETWLETCIRVADFSFRISEFHPLASGSHCLSSSTAIPSRHTLKEFSEYEVREFLFALYHQEFFVSGRTMWRGFYPIDGVANSNCSFVTMDEIDKLYDIFYLLLCGVGVGVSLQHKYLWRISRFTHKQIFFEDYEWDGTTNGETKITDNLKEGSRRIVVGDSREGWSSVVVEILKAHLIPNESITNIFINFNQVRPAGLRLNTMGGHTSGHLPLLKFLKKVRYILCQAYYNERKHGDDTRRLSFTLSSLQWLDVVTSLAEAVVVGGIRRSSIIILFDKWDKAIFNCKKDLFKYSCDESELSWEVAYTDFRAYLTSRDFDFNLKPKVRWQSNRVLSNNSVYCDESFSGSDLDDIFENIRENGEPGFVNSVAALKRHPNFKGCNPCGEILCDDRQLCNLVEINLPKLVTNYGEDFLHRFYIIANLATRHALRIAALPLFSSEWQEKVNNIGVALGGFIDAERIYGRQLPLDYFKTVVHSAVKDDCDEHGITMNDKRYPHLSTTIKPSGTISSIAGISSGIHYPYAPNYIRRVRFIAGSPIALALRELGFEPTPENGYTNLDFSHTWVFSFPVSSSAEMDCNEIPAIVQLENYKRLMLAYTDHNVSCTISLDFETELDEVKNWVKDNWDVVVGMSFLPKLKQNNFYKQLPFETITESEFSAMTNLEISEWALVKQIAATESVYDAKLDLKYAESCSNGVCSLR